MVGRNQENKENQGEERDRRGALRNDPSAVGGGGAKLVSTYKWKTTHHQHQHTAVASVSESAAMQRNQSHLN